VVKNAASSDALLVKCQFDNASDKITSKVDTLVRAAYQASVTSGKPLSADEITKLTNELMYRESVIQTLSEGGRLLPIDLIRAGFTNLENAFKTQVFNKLSSLPVADRDTFDEIKSAIDKLTAEFIAGTNN
jgi:hypothetical protein